MGAEETGKGWGMSMVTTAEHGAATETTDTVHLRVPADPAYLAVIRTATAGLAARLDLTLDEIEDLRIAVDEACALLLEHKAHPGEDLHAAFTLRPHALDVVVQGPAHDLPRRSSYAWSVLEALVGQVETGAAGGGSWIRLTHVGGRRS
jgi:serine/threonine-protein kinase RsbW